MRIFIDGDSCNVIEIAESVARKHKIPTDIYCDTKRIIDSNYSTVHVVDSGRDAADYAIVNACSTGDIVITNDSGLASMALAKRALPVNTKGVYYTEENIMNYLNRRYIRAYEAMRTNRKNVKGIEKNRPKCYDFRKSLKGLINRSKQMLNKEEDASISE